MWRSYCGRGAEAVKRPRYFSCGRKYLITFSLRGVYLPRENKTLCRLKARNELRRRKMLCSP